MRNYGTEPPHILAFIGLAICMRLNPQSTCYTVGLDTLDQGINKVQICSDLEISKTSSYHIFAELKAWANMKYIDEVCAVLTDEVERRYLRSRDAWQLLSDEVSAADAATLE